MVEISNKTNLTDKEIEEIIEKFYKDKSDKTKNFIRRALKKYGDIYDYSEVEYNKNTDKVKIFCPICKEFFIVQAANFTFKTAAGCPKCTKKRSIQKLRDNGRKIFEEFLYDNFGNDYVLEGEYKSNSDRVNVRETATGKLYSVIPSVVHRSKSIKKVSSIGEENVRRALDSLGIEYQAQKSFTVGEVPDLYKVRSQKLVVDFYLEYGGIKFIIEYNGEQHYREANKFSKGSGPSEVYIKQIKRDQILNTYCACKGYCLIVIPYTITKESSIRDGLEDVILLGNIQNVQKHFPDLLSNPVSSTDSDYEVVVL